jgi:hypothetical protein
MIPKRAIEKAIEGGLKPNGGWHSPYGMLAPNHLAQCGMALDPTFWRALGKALNWPSDDPTEPSPVLLDEWKRTCPRGRANQFFNLVYVGGDLTAYWDELLP